MVVLPISELDIVEELGDLLTLLTDETIVAPEGEHFEWLLVASGLVGTSRAAALPVLKEVGTMPGTDLVAVGKADCLMGGITKFTLLLRTAFFTGGCEITVELATLVITLSL